MTTTEPIADPKQHLKIIQQRIFGIKRLAAMPQVTWQLMQALSDEDTTVSRLAIIIESDPALASKVLSMVNSAYYGFSTTINSVDRAATLVGFHELQVLAMGAGLSEVFDLKKVPPGFDGEGLWVHCLAVSWLAHKLAEACHYPLPSEAMIAGLLHDLGKLVLATSLSDLYAQVLELERGGMPYYEAESRLMLHHVVIGSWLARRWELPAMHVEAIRYHHLPSPGLPYHVTTYLTFLANRAAKELGFGLVQQAKDVSVVPYSKVLGLSEALHDQVVGRARQELPPFLERMRGLLSGGEQA